MDLELQLVVSHCVDAGNQNQVLCKCCKRCYPLGCLSRLVTVLSFLVVLSEAPTVCEIGRNSHIPWWQASRRLLRINAMADRGKEGTIG